MESNSLLKKYIFLFLNILSQTVNKPVDLEMAKRILGENNSLPLGFNQWFVKYGNDMLFKLSKIEVKESFSDKTLDELDYYLMILREDLKNVDSLDTETICSDLVASLDKLYNIIATEKYQNL